MKYLGGAGPRAEMGSSDGGTSESGVIGTGVEGFLPGVYWAGDYQDEDNQRKRVSPWAGSSTIASYAGMNLIEKAE